MFILNRVTGSALLIAGCCIGAGMLGLPVLSAMAGFGPTLILFAVSWLFMMSTGLLLLEVNLYFLEPVSLITMAEKTLGEIGKKVTWGLFLFLFYSLMVAYVAGSGKIAGALFPERIGSLLFTVLVGILIYSGTRAVDLFNRVLMLGLIISYLGLLFTGIGDVKLEYLFHADWSRGFPVVPTMIISFGFHNLVPSLTSYLNRNRIQLTQAIFFGSLIPLLMYLAWEFLILGIIPLPEFQVALDRGEIATSALVRVIGSGWVVLLAEHFAFFAIITSFLGVSLSFVDFLADGLGIQKDRKGSLLLTLLVLLPPFACAMLYPSIFLFALTTAGAFGASILFGVLPAAMVWMGRYTLDLGLKPILPGGKVSLFLIITFAFLVVGMELMEILMHA